MKSLIKMFAIKILRNMMRLFYVFPIKSNRIIFNAYRGSQYSCNPKYISNYLLHNFPDKFEIIWAFNRPQEYNFLQDDGIKIVKFCSIKRFYYEATAKISINNVGSYSWLPKRLGQEHVNTWHAGFGYKKIGLGEVNNDALMKKTIQMSSDETTLITVPCQEFYDDIVKKDLGYSGDIIKSGYARNDVLFKQKNGQIDLKTKIAKHFSFGDDTIVVLYAPTWRYKRAKKPLGFDFKNVIDIVSKRKNKRTVILYRMHHLTESKVTCSENVIDATNYSDMQELLAVADILITDYSSSIWDFSVMEKPIIIFADDIEDYEKNRGYHLPVTKWGFPICRNSEALIETLKNMNEDEMAKLAINHRRMAGDFELGNACKQIGEWIVGKCFDEVK